MRQPTEVNQVDHEMEKKCNLFYVPNSRRTHTSSFVHLLNFRSLSFSIWRPMECAPSGMSSSLWILFIRPFLWFYISIFAHMLEFDQSISYSLNSCPMYECDRMAWPCHDEFNFFFVSLLCASHLFPFFEWQTMSRNRPNPSGWSSTYFYSSQFPYLTLAGYVIAFYCSRMRKPFFFSFGRLKLKRDVISNVKWTSDAEYSSKNEIRSTERWAGQYRHTRAPGTHHRRTTYAALTPKTWRPNYGHNIENVLSFSLITYPKFILRQSLRWGDQLVSGFMQSTYCVHALYSYLRVWWRAAIVIRTFLDFLFFGALVCECRARARIVCDTRTCHSKSQINMVLCIATSPSTSSSSHWNRYK